MYSLEKIATLANIYGSTQKITFESQTAFSTPDVDKDLTDAE